MLPPSYPGFFLTIEGIEGVGKSTTIKFIDAFLTEAKQDFVLTREPGGTPVAEELRKLLLSPSNETITPETELMLMFASRSQHIANVILPALQKGHWVVSDRFVDASFAYQGGGRKIDTDVLHFLDKWIVKDLIPQATILLDAPPEIGLLRAKNKGSHDRIEQEQLDFFERVRIVYLQRAQEDPHRFFIIDATQPVEVVQQKINNLLQQWLKKKESQ